MRVIAKTRPLCDEYVGTVRAEKLPRSGCARLFLVVMATALGSGCAAVALTAGGVAAAVGVNHTLNGIVYKTFSEPLPKVKRATLTALKQMEIPVEAVEKTKQGELIKAKAANRAIEVEFEALTPKTTRMRVVADSEALIKDSATATEIILQTERALPAT
jgi:Protein of unknown function (DUF3568)